MCRKCWLMVPLVLALIGGWPASASGAGIPLKVWLSMRWVESVLEKDAPRMEAAVREEVARAVAEECVTHELDPALVMAVMKVESGFRVNAVSPRGARGLMQVMPRVAGELTSGAVDANALEDPATNVRLGATILRSFINEYDGQLPRALAAYNMGSKRLKALLHSDGRLKDGDFRYARLVLSAAERYRARFPRSLGAEG